jgi:inward rectifier potassium channel
MLDITERTDAARRLFSSKLRLGGYEVGKKGVARFDFGDPYHLAVSLSWPRMLLLLVMFHTAINLGFALLYLGRPGAVANARPGSISDAYFFSLETSSTVGYGEMYPASAYGRVVSGTEIIVGLAFTALVTGLLFVRFSRPKARFCYAGQAVVASHAGRPTLMVRIANGRQGLLADATASLTLMRKSRDGGTVLRQMLELRLTRTRLPVFPLTWTLMHEIDAASPLHGYDDAGLLADDVRLFLAVEARDVTLAATVLDVRDYGPGQILFGMRYAEAICLDANGHPIADLTRVGSIERDVGPEPPQPGWVDSPAGPPR